MKIFKWTISVLLWTVITVNVLFLGISHLPSAQHYMGAKVAEAVGEMLGTSVSIGRVDLGMLNRLIIDDLVILDQNSQEMVRAARMSVSMNLLPLLDGKVAISSAQLFGARFRLYRQDADSPLNCQFAIDSLASSDTTSQKPLYLRVNSLIIRHSSLTFDQHDKPQTEGLLNPAHLRVSDISAHINLKTLTDDSLNVNVKRLSFNEHSGLSLKSLNGRLEAGRTHAILRDFKLQMPSSLLQIDTLTADYATDGNRLKPGSLSFAGDISDSHITPSDLRSFSTALKNFQRPVSLQASFNGTDRRVNIPDLRISTSEDDIDVQVNGWLENWQKQLAWHLQMNRFQLSETSIDFLSKTIPGIPTEITRLGSLTMNGTTDRDASGYTTLKATVQSGAGNVDLQFNMDQQKVFSGELQAEEVSLRQLLDHEELGSLSAQLTLHGQLQDRQNPDFSADGTVSRFDYKGYSYQNIKINGEYAQHSLSGTCAIDDPNARLTLTGQWTDALPGEKKNLKRVLLDGTVSHLVPSALKLTDTWEESVFSADIHADFTASSLNDAQGILRISKGNVTGTPHHKPYQLDNLIVTSGYEDGIHYVNLKSDFADATLKGLFNFETLPQSLSSLIAHRLPSLPGLLPIKSDADNNFSLRLMMSKTDWLKRFLNVDLTLKEPLMLNARVNDRTHDIWLDGDIPSFAYNGDWYADGDIRITTPGDTLHCDIGILKLLDNGASMRADASIRAANNRMNTSLTWDNHQQEKRIGGQMNGIIQLYQNLENMPEAHLRILPSHIILHEGTWDVEPADIIYHKDRLLVDNFMVRRGKQHIIVDGIASPERHDFLTVDLNEVEVGYILELVNFHSVEFSGKATGKAKASALLDKFAASANLRVDDFKFEEGRMGVLHADVEWNAQDEQIDISAVAKDGPGVNTFVDGYISPTHNTIDLAISADSTYIDFMHNFTKSFLSQVTGHANGDVRLAGTLDNINLTGQLTVDGNLTVEALNTTYTLAHDTVTFIPDDIQLRRLRVTDRDGHEAFLSGGIHHRHLTSLTFDLVAETDHLLAYDFPSFTRPSDRPGIETEEAPFYGTIYASGNITIQGRPGEVTIDCRVTPLKNSFFVYNAANPDAISRQEFIHWEEDYSRSVEGGVWSENTLSAESAPSNTLQGNPSNTLQGNLTPHSTLHTPRIIHTPQDKTDIYLNFLVNATPDATLKLLMDASTNDYITLNGDGTIRATYHNKGTFDMFGTYTVDHGTYDVTIQNILSKNFTFNRGGTIVFGGNPYEAALDLQAVHTVNGVSLSDLNIGNSFSSNTIRVNCLMNIGGQAAAPQVDFDLEMPTVNADEQQMIRSIINGQQEMNQQVIYLLGIGRFYTQGANNSANTNTETGATSLAMQSLLSGTLTAQINNLLNQFVKNDNWNFGANITTGNEGWHNAEYEGIVNGRMFNNRLLLNGQFGYRDNAKQATPSFIGDFDLQYLLYPNGNLALKVYNQTNDRYFTKSSLNTQGLGIIMKKDFNGLRDLFSSKKRKKRKQKPQ